MVLQEPNVPGGIEELLVDIEEVADEEIGEQNIDDAKVLAARLESTAVKLRAGIRSAENEAHEGCSINEAREIMGDKFFGVEAAVKTIGRELRPDEVPPIPSRFTPEQLKREKRLGHMLVLRPEKTPDGQALTMENQNNLLAPRYAQGGKGKILNTADKPHCWYTQGGGEDFFKVDKLKMEWVLVSTEVIPGSLNKNAVAQMRVLAEYVRKNVFENDVPPDYAEAIAEFESQEGELSRLMDTDWKLCCEKLAALKLAELCGCTPAEDLFDCQDYFVNTGRRRLETTFDRTLRLSSFGDLVGFGGADSAGAGLDSWYPRSHYPGVGRVFARKS